MPMFMPLKDKILSGEIRVSELPPDDKDEILMISIAERNKTFRQFIAKIKYTSDNKRYLDDVWKESPSDTTGRMIIKEW